MPSRSQAIKLLSQFHTLESKSAITWSTPTTLPGYYPTPPPSYAMFSTDFVEATRGSLGLLFSEAFAQVAEVVSKPVIQTVNSDITILSAGGMNQPPGVIGRSFTSLASDNSVDPDMRHDIWLFDSFYNNIPSRNQIGAVLHEVGHSLGLRHSTFFSEFSEENSWKYTNMAYRAPSQWSSGYLSDTADYLASSTPTTMQLYDYWALQSIYGVDTSTRSTAGDVYGAGLVFNSASSLNQLATIWDSGGISDSFDASGARASTIVDLRQGEFSSVGAQNTLSDPLENIAIAWRTQIENAQGSSYSDVIIGNVADNEIDGGGGNDIIFGDGDVYGSSSAAAFLADGIAWSPKDKLETGEDWQGDGASTVSPSSDGSGNDRLSGNTGNDRLFGGKGEDRLDGGDGDDRLWGNAGSDVLDGGAGNDTALYENTGKPIAITYDGASVLTITDGNGGSDTLTAIEKIIGTASRDTLTIIGNIANGTNLTVDANGGQSPNPRDTINTAKAGPGGIDIFIDPASAAGYVMSKATAGKINLVNFHTSVVGSDYDDTIIDHSIGAKEIMAGDGNDFVEVSVGQASISGGEGDDELIGGEGNDELIGGNGQNILRGGAGHDLIMSTSDDVIEGGEGDDLITLKHYAESVRGGAGNDIIDITSGTAENIYFSSGDGHDTVISDGYYSANVKFDDVSMHDVSFIFQIKDTEWIMDNDDSTLPLIFVMRGDVAISLNATGDTIVVPNQVIYRYHEWDGDAENYVGAPNYYRTSWSRDLSFIDGTIDQWESDNNSGFFDFGGSSLVFDDVASLRTSIEGFNVAVGQGASTEGSEDADSLSGSSGADNYNGGAGNDSIEASAGSDTIDGGEGEDELVLLGSEADYKFVRNADGSTLVTSIGGRVSGTLFTNIESVSFLADGSSLATSALFTGVGTVGNDTLHGTKGADEITGLAGNDVIRGGRGNDIVDGGDGDDTVVFSGSAETYSAYRSTDGSLGIFSSVGTDGYDSLVNVEWIKFEQDGIQIAVSDLPGDGTSDDDVITGTAMIDSLYGGEGDDTLTGFGGADRLNGEGGSDTLIGGMGNDTYYVDVENDLVIELDGEGLDTIYSSASNFTLPNYVENLNLEYPGQSGLPGLNGNGNAGDNIITGNYYDNVIQGFDGDDTIISGFGSDTINGGDGFDTVVFGYSSTNYVITRNVDDSLSVSGPYGIWQSSLTGVERIRFLGDGIDVDASTVEPTTAMVAPPQDYSWIDTGHWSGPEMMVLPEALIV